MQRQPKFAEFATYRLASWIRQCIDEYKEPLIQTCITCICFREHARNDANEKHPAEWCMKYNERPPARIIAYGCNSYANDEDIPF